MVDTTESQCRKLLAKQHGIISREQALTLGLTKHQIDNRLAAGEWLAVTRGVYRASITRQTWHQQLSAMLLRVGEGSAVSHRAAAALLKLEGFAPGWVEVSSPNKFRMPEAKKTLIHRARGLCSDDVMNLDSLQCTNLARTLVDLASVIPFPQLENTLEAAFRQRPVSPHHLKSTLDRVGAGRKGSAELRQWLQDRGAQASTESDLETRVAQFFRYSKIPKAVRQYWVGLPNNARARMRSSPWAGSSS
jgi:hypothetical protein